MSESCGRQPTETSIAFRQYILRAIVTEFLTLRGSVPSSKANVVSAALFHILLLVNIQNISFTVVILLCF